jgi:biotin transport system substrate-specific component
MNTSSLTRMALCVAITAICAQIVIPIPFSPVPLSLSLLGVFLTGALLSKWQAGLAQLAYILLGAVGAPIFSGFAGGLAKVAGPTGGYIVAYPIMAFVIALIAEKAKKQSFPLYCIGMGVSLLICYLLGTVWLSVMSQMDFASALMAGVIPFIPLDCVKVVLSASFAPLLHRRLSPILQKGKR